MFHGGGWMGRRRGQPQSSMHPHHAYPLWCFLQEEGIYFLLVFEVRLDCKEQEHDWLSQVLRTYFWGSSRGSNRAEITCVESENRHSWIWIWALIFPDDFRHMTVPF